jgi:predicted MFS family arabinose efflux permease
LTILTVTLALSYVDRYLLAILVQPIKADLGLSDSQIGLLTGLAFSVFYATIGLPLAHFADRGHRRAVVCGSIAVWSLMTAATSAVTSFAQLAIVRFGVGAGEAGVFPTAQAIIADSFSEDRRSSAMAIFASGGSIGLLLAFALGGAVEAQLGWRLSFVAFALPGIVVAPLAFLLLPRFRETSTVGLTGDHLPSSVAQLWRNPHFRHLPFAQSAIVILLFGQAAWLPAFFERSFAMPRTTIGLMLGLVIGLATIGGGIIGGYLADRIRVRDEAGPMRFAFWSVVAGAPFVSGLYLMPNAWAALLLVAPTCFFFSMPTGVIAAHLQFVVNPRQRASAAAWAVMIASLLGGGLGPLAIGSASDLLGVFSGDDGLRYALLVVASAAIAWALWHLSRLVRLCSARASSAPWPNKHPSAVKGM